jgi:hypothetical protein
LAREERDGGKRVKIGSRKIQINGDWFRWRGEENDSGLQRWGRGERENRNGKEGEEREKVQEVTRGDREREGNGEKYGAKTAGRWMKE